MVSLPRIDSSATVKPMRRPVRMTGKRGRQQHVAEHLKSEAPIERAAVMKILST